MIYAYCWQDGTLGFGKKIPKGALEIARGGKKIKHTVQIHASDDYKFIPSVRLAYLGVTNDDPVDCLNKFIIYINAILKKELRQ